MMDIPARWAYLAVFVGVLGHASSEFFAVLTGIRGAEVSVWRYLIGGLGLVVWALATPGARDLWTPLKEEGWYFVVLALLGVSIAYLFFHWSLDYATVTQVATVVTTIPIFVAFANWVVNGERPSPVKIATGIMAVIAVALLITDGAIESLFAGAGSLFGVLLAVLCAGLVAFYSVMIKPLMKRQGTLRITALGMMMGGIGLWFVVGIFWGSWVNPLNLFAYEPSPVTQGIDPGWWILVLALWNTTITQLLWLGGLASAPDITRASYLFFLKPVIAALLAIWVLSQYPSALEVAAIIVVTGSVFVEMFWERLSGRVRKLRAE